MKAYTDLSQSKKLAEILPLESADMIWVLANPDLPMIKAIAYEDSEKSKYYEILPAWSLAALLGVLPNGKNVSTTLSRGGWNIESVEYVDKWWCEYEDDTHTKDFSVSADNPVDACYELVLKLHELNLL